MTTKVKDLLKGLRYISHMFDSEKEQEIQIGYPTDVKHVAHIGWDGPSVNSPSWMNEFKTAPNFSSGPLSRTEEETKPIVPKGFSEELSRTGPGMQDSPFRNVLEKPKIPRRHHSSGLPSPVDSPRRRSESKQSRRHHSAGSSVDSQTGESGSARGGRRRHQNSGLGLESPSKDSPSIPRHSRRRKSKGSNSAGGSTRSSRRSESSITEADTLSDPNLGSVPESGHEPKKSDDPCSNSVSNAQEEEKRCSEIS
ncbi:CRIB domain-containing protein RIC5 [Malania oleifera]|uniref:CRIB domain-containing protein RIC5 n=1 Tax=Malania oleifera TaxID=397392 RepID=UPI0025AE898B|nr:CRIB domain-containing protein RIC5 [Malania oleifera]